MRDVILTCAVTGNLTTPDQTPYLPITPDQIANSLLEAADTGAAIAHIHVREPETGRPSMELDLYRDVVERIRAKNRSMILNLTTGPGGRFAPRPDNPRVAGEGTTLLPPLERIEHIEALRPEICTLDLNTMNSGAQVVINTPGNVAIMAEAMLAAGVKPELELFDSGDVVLASDLLKQFDFPAPPMASFVLGVKYGFPPRLESIQLAASLLPPDVQWTAFGIGRHAFPMVAQSVLLGGHARVGLEDTVYLAKGQLAPSNAALCTKAVRIIEDLGYQIASPATARKMLGLAPV